MTTETRKRIRAYKRMLPELRERVIAVALLLAMSVSMLGTASYAWLTISRRPEVTGASTTIAANGNLEIALVEGTTNTVKVPGESQVGDSSSAKGQSVAAANITWGNLINLSDPSYGLENLTMRPAQLNLSSLLISPLYGAVYQGDGRVEKLDSSFAYATWDTENKLFMVSDELGVRAISSTTIEAVGFAEQVYQNRSKASDANLAAGGAYTAITTNKDWMNSLAVVMGTFMTAKMNAGQGDANLTNPSMAQKDIQNLTALFGAFVEVYDLQFEAMAQLANYQLFLKNNSESGATPYTPKTAEDMKLSTTTEASLKKEGLQVSGLNQAQRDYPKLVDGYAQLQELSQQGNVKWSDSGLDTIVNGLMNVGTCTLDGTPINNIGVSNASGYLDGKTHNAFITNGVLFNFEKMNGTRCYVEELSVSAKVKRLGVTIPATISANISTTAPVPAQFYVDLEYGDALNQGAQGVEIAQDTYGLAVDLWVRTNATGSYLTLEGNILTKSHEEPLMGKNADGQAVPLYTVTRKTEVTEENENGEEVTTTVDVTIDLYPEKIKQDPNTGYYSVADDNTKWFSANAYTEFALEEDEIPLQKMQTITEVIGYEGENRIWEDANAWEDNSQLSLDSTTQGSGSCYVYYADSPEDQARSLELLDAMHIAFLDAQGALLATAIMDTEHFFPENGRVTVPLVLRSDSPEIGTNLAGEKLYGITQLEKNVPKRITAIVYLDGTKLSNEDVLAASEIQGKLNIQFGSSTLLSHAEDELLFGATRSVRATVSQASFSYDQSLETNTPMKTTVTVNVAGDEPASVTAFFIRAISATQGSREQTMTFTKQEDGSWKTDYVFTAPGEYVLRSVELDGQPYDLAECPEVLVEGFTIQSLTCTQAVNRHITILTADASRSVDLKLQFASHLEEAMPTTVQGRFLRDDGSAVNINFTYNSDGPDKGLWTGKANFISSGEYALQYLVLDGEYTELDSGLWQSATVNLGMKTAVYTNSPISFRYIPDELTDNQRNLYMQVSIMDNTGKEMNGLPNAHLYYAMEGSSLPENGMDAALTWNANTGFYECTFPSDIGVYKFNYVTVGSNSITYAETSPTFRIMPPDPPSFTSLGTDGGKTIFHPNRDATMTASLDYSSTATVMALIRKDIKDSSGRVTSTAKYYVIGEAPNTSGNTTQWKFKLPNMEAQDGYWTMEELYVWDYYSADGQLITTTLKKTDNTEWNFCADGAAKWIRAAELNFTNDNACMRIPVADKNYWKKIVQTVDIDFAPGQSQNFTGNGFLEPYKFNGLNVEFTDFQGMPIVNENGNSIVNSVKLTFTYSGNSDSYGGYTSDQLTAAAQGATVEVTLSNDGSNSRFVQTQEAELLYAGTYTTKFEYQIGTATPKSEYNTDDDARANMPVFTVTSNSPTVMVTGVSPTGTFRVNSHASAASGGGFTELSGVSNSFTDYYATVYIQYTGATLGTWRNYAEPSVTLTLSNMTADFTSASMTFNHPTSDYARTFTFVPNQLSQTQEIGHANEPTVTDANPMLFYAGEQTVNELTVIKDGMEFAVDLSSAVTINQPQYPPHAIFNSTASGQTLPTTPSTIYGTPHADGTFTITLPATQTWTEAMSTTSNEDFDVQPGYPQNATVYTTRSETSGCSTTNYYTPYTKTTTVSVASSSTTTWTRTWRITGWKIGSTTYAVGETISITGRQTVTAVLSYADGTKTTSASTTTRTEYYYTSAGSEQQGNAPGTTINASELSYTITNPYINDVATTS